MDGRWSQSPQVGERDRAQDRIAALAAPFPVGAARALDVAASNSDPPFCIAINDDNFQSPDLVIPGRALSGIVTAVVELNGTGVKCEARVTFDTIGLKVQGPVQFKDEIPS
jgi:hypothetical protein